MTLTERRISLFFKLSGVTPKSSPNDRVLGKALFAKGVAHVYGNKEIKIVKKVFDSLCTEDERNGTRYKLVQYALLTSSHYGTGEVDENDYIMRLVVQCLDKDLLEKIATIEYESEEVGELFGGTL